MRPQFFILLTAVFLWGCETPPEQEAAISPDFKPGGGSHAYSEVVMRVYMHAWEPAKSATNVERVARVSVVIARDGSVVSAKIVTPSGDEQVDKSVQLTLDKIRFVQPFESGAKEDRRTFTINFDLKVKT